MKPIAFTAALLLPTLAFGQSAPTLGQSGVNAAGNPATNAADIQTAFQTKQDYNAPGVFTSLTASGAVSGAGITALLAPYAPLASPSFTGSLGARGTTTLLLNTGRDIAITDGTTRAQINVANGWPLWFQSHLQLASVQTPQNAVEFTLLGYSGNTVPLTGSQTYSLLSGNVAISGSSTSGAVLPYNLNVSNFMDSTAIPNGLFGAQIAIGNLGSASGGSTALTVSNTVNGGSVTNQYAIASNLWTQASVNAGGTATTGAAAKGTMFAINPQVWLQPGATYWQGMNPQENDVILQGTSQTATIGGTATNADTISLTFASTSIAGSPVTVTASIGTSNTTSVIANKLAAAVEANSALTAAGVAGIVSTAGTSVLNLYWPFPNSVSVSSGVTGSATETVTLGSVVPGASVSSKAGLSIVHTTADTAQGALGSDTGLSFGAQNTPQSSMWNTLIGVGGNAGSFPVDRLGTILKIGPQTVLGGFSKTGLLSPTKLFAGIDFQQGNFTQAGGYAFRSPAFSVDGAGNIITGSASISPIAAGLAIDAKGSQATAVAISAAGGGGSGNSSNNYYVGDTLTDAYGGQYHVTSVNAVTGGIIGLAMDVAPTITSGSTPSNPIALNFGSGIGATVNLTWGSAAVLSLQPGGGTLKAGIGMFSANGAVATTMTSLGPTGSHTTVQEWLTVTDAGGTVRYIPAY